jgi:hypothetical protein
MYIRAILRWLVDLVGKLKGVEELWYYMSNQKKTDEEELLRQFEKMLSEGGFDVFDIEEEEDFGYYHPPNNSGLHSSSSDDDGDEEGEPPPVPKETKRINRFCKHSNKVKKYLVTSYYYYCPDCKNEVE